MIQKGTLEPVLEPRYVGFHFHMFTVTKKSARWRPVTDLEFNKSKESVPPFQNGDQPFYQKGKMGDLHWCISTFAGLPDKDPGEILPIGAFPTTGETSSAQGQLLSSNGLFSSNQNFAIHTCKVNIMNTQSGQVCYFFMTQKHEIYPHTWQILSFGYHSLIIIW